LALKKGSRFDSYAFRLKTPLQQLRESLAIQIAMTADINRVDQNNVEEWIQELYCAIDDGLEQCQYRILPQGDETSANR